jgi:hypothetical protein
MHWVYVIELNEDAGSRVDPRIPWVYVGSSAIEPEARFLQHIHGYRAAGVVRKFGYRLRPDLYKDIEAIYDRDEAVAMEFKRARQLGRSGFVARTNGCQYPSRPQEATNIREWGARRLSVVEECVDAAIRSLVRTIEDSLTPRICGHLLYGTRRSWAAAYIDPDNPPPEFGLFSHVRLEVLQRHVQKMVNRGDLVSNRKLLHLP